MSSYSSGIFLGSWDLESLPKILNEYHSLAEGSEENEVSTDQVYGSL